MFNSVSENRAMYEIMWKNMIEPHSEQMTYYGACSMVEATHARARTHARTHAHIHL